MVRLMTARNAMEARIIAARLGSEGIVWEFRGSVDGPLAVGPVEVLVDEDGYESARELVLADGAGPASWAREPRATYVTTGRDVLTVALVLVAVLVMLVVARFLLR